MSSSHLSDVKSNVNDTTRHFAIRAFKAMGMSNINQSSESGRRMSAPMQVSNPPSLNGIFSGADLASQPFDNAVEIDTAILSSAIAPADWNLLFSAIAWRLRLTVCERLAGAPAPEADNIASQVQAAVLECIADMELLHAALYIERGNMVPEQTAL